MARQGGKTLQGYSYSRLLADYSMSIHERPAPATHHAYTPVLICDVGNVASFAQVQRYPPSAHRHRYNRIVHLRPDVVFFNARMCLCFRVSGMLVAIMCKRVSSPDNYPPSYRVSQRCVGAAPMKVAAPFFVVVRL